jgi:hypothetical protein
MQRKKTPTGADTCFCPDCGSQNTLVSNQKPNGNRICIAEEVDDFWEFYDYTQAWMCDDCHAEFYIEHFGE